MNEELALFFLSSSLFFPLVFPLPPRDGRLAGTRSGPSFLFPGFFSYLLAAVIESLWLRE